MLMELTLTLLVNSSVCRVLKIQARIKEESYPRRPKTSFPLISTWALRFILRKLRIEDKGRNMEKELGAIHEELSISLSLIPSLMCYEVSFMQLKFFLESYLSHVSIYGDFCPISFGGGLVLVVSYASKCLFSYAFLEESLLHSGSMFDPSFHDFGVMINASSKSIVVDFGLHGALFDILHDKCSGKFVEYVGYVSSFLDTFMENHNGFVSLNQLMSFVSDQVEFSCNTKAFICH
ncbi:hypothetical protein M9H77_02073 [Catharanthus roseus]|uniref:Uncharacterized protein n=1 Tax=Catharanthus roseus TaxID=4058 RepID=A0ACC0C7T2_CATRO|nr:hypothetical protein M9H77_02073 [Catharanthus roseus]